MRNVDTQHESCLSCKFWATVKVMRSPNDAVSFIGKCKKNAPIVGADGAAVWPTTDAEDWCASYEQGTTPNEAKRFL